MSLIPNKAHGEDVALGLHDKVVKICDLPNTEDYTSSDGKLFDFGYKYTLFELLFMPVFEKGEGEIIGYIDNDNYVSLSNSDIENIVRTNKIYNLAGMVKIPFWDAWGGKIALFCLASLLVCLFFINRYCRLSNKTKEL